MSECSNCKHYEDKYPTCDECDYKPIDDDKPIKAKQLIFTFSYKYNYKFEFKENIIELYPDEFDFYQYKENIELDSGFGNYQLTSEIFIPIDSSNEYINQIKLKVKKAMEKWFEKRIEDLTQGLKLLKEKN